MNEEELDKLNRMLLAKLCHSTYGEVVDYIDSQTPAMRKIIEAILESDLPLGSLASKKIRLADIILENAGIEYQPEDRLRCLYLLAKLSGSNFKSACQSFKSEFGDNFAFQEEYLVGQIKHSWKEIALKAKTIVNGYKNLNLLIARKTVEYILSGFNNFRIKDLGQLTTVLELTGDLLAFIQKRIIDPQTNEIDIVRTKLIQLAQLCGWVKLEIEKLNQETDFAKYTDFVQQIRFVAMAKVYLINNKIPIDNPEPARAELLKFFAHEINFLYRGDSMLRQHIKLPAKK